MLKFINKLTGSAMYVAEDRKEEYLAAGHKLAADSSAKKEAAAEKVKATTKRTRK